MPLYRVLVVDDEPHIVRTIAALLASQEHMSLDVYRAYDVKEALNWLARTRIDIVITDIEMGAESGLDLLCTIKRRWPLCKAILLTAHSDFNYAYRAMRLDVASYILKTESDEHILSEVERVIKLIEDEFSQQRYIADAQSTMDSANAELRKLVFSCLVGGQSPPSGERYADMLRAVRLNESDTRLILVVARVHAPPRALGDALRAVRILAGRDLTSLFRHSACESFDDYVVWILQTPLCDAGDALPARLSDILENMLHAAELGAQCLTAFALSVCVSAVQLAARYRASLQLLQRDDAPFKPYVYSFENNAAPEGGAFKLMAEITEYLDAHIFGDTSLIALAEKTGYNPSYLSRAFGERMGESLNKYISRVKLKRIEDMMLKQNLSLNDIAKYCGFESRSYFNHYIKRLTGLTPQELRDTLDA